MNIVSTLSVSKVAVMTLDYAVATMNFRVYIVQCMLA